MVAPSKFDVIYIRPSVDTLYLGTAVLLDLDINAFIARPENQLIENLAISAVSAMNLRWVGSTFGRDIGTRTYIGDLVRGLKNLKKLYIVEGGRLHMDSRVTRWVNKIPRRHIVTLVDVPTETTLPKYDWHGRDSYFPPAKPWLESGAKRIVAKFEEEVKRENSGLYELKFNDKDWTPPKVICRGMIKREMSRFPIFTTLPLNTLLAATARSGSPSPKGSTAFTPVDEAAVALAQEVFKENPRRSGRLKKSW